MFEISVEVAKIFWLLVKEFEIDLRGAYTLRRDCIDEVKNNEVIGYPFIKNNKKDVDAWFFD